MTNIVLNVADIANITIAIIAHDRCPFQHSVYGGWHTCCAHKRNPVQLTGCMNIQFYYNLVLVIVVIVLHLDFNCLRILFQRRERRRKGIESDKQRERERERERELERLPHDFAFLHVIHFFRRRPPAALMNCHSSQLSRHFTHRTDCVHMLPVCKLQST